MANANKRGFTSTGVWDRSVPDAQLIPRRAFYAVMTFWTLVGLFTAAGMAFMTLGVEPTLGFILGLFALSLVGVFITSWASDQNSFLLGVVGYFFIAAPMGAMIGPLVALYTTVSVLSIFAATIVVTAGLGLLGTFIPRSLESWRGYLFGALWMLIVLQFGALFAGLAGLPVSTLALSGLDWLGVAIFVGLIVFDFNRAARIQPTHTAALLCAVQIFLDFINLFIRLLSLFGKAKD